MILTCPECATSYFVADGSIPPEGRRVKCTTCQARWMVDAEGRSDGVVADVEAQPAAEKALATPDAIAHSAPPPEPPKGKAWKPPAAAPDPRRRIMVWATTAGLAVVMIASALIFREQIVRVWPKSSGAYAGIGLPVSGGGLVIEKINARPGYAGGRPVLAVSGQIRNLRDVPVDAPPVRFTLFNRAGQPVAAKVATPQDAQIPAHGERRFTVNLQDPPKLARDLEVAFDVRGRKHAVVEAAAPAEEAETAPEPAGHPPAGEEPAHGASHDGGHEG